MNLTQVIQTHPALSLEDVVRLKAEIENQQSPFTISELEQCVNLPMAMERFIEILDASNALLTRRVAINRSRAALAETDKISTLAEIPALLRAHDTQWEEAIIAVLPPMPNEPGEVELAREIAKKIRARIASAAPIVSLRFTCPFDGAMWAFHSQEQLDMIQAHLDAHAAREKA